MSIEFVVVTTTISYAELFPRGISQYLVGGLLIGIGTALIYWTTGIIAGASTFLESTLSYGSSLSRFQHRRFVESRNWRVVFTAGIVLGAGGYQFLGVGNGWITDVQWWRLLGGGILVGMGTRIGKGCTSGHGICGVGSGSQTSILNVGVFLFVAIGTALLVQALGVTP